MGDAMVRLESAVSATASGDLTWDRWTLDSATALGLSGLRNPLGFAMVRWFSDQNTTALWAVIMNLASILVKNGVDAGLAREIAFRAVEFFNALHCPSCGGRGSLEHGGKTCHRCGGSGDRPLTDAPDSIREAVSALLEAQRWMESQLRSRLKKTVS